MDNSLFIKIIQPLLCINAMRGYRYMTNRGRQKIS